VNAVEINGRAGGAVGGPAAGARWRRAVAPLGRAFVALVPSRRLALLVAVAAPVWLASASTVGATLATLLTVLIAVAALADALTTPAHWQVAVERAFPERLGLGDTVDAHYAVRTVSRRTLRFTLHDALPRGVSVGRAWSNPQEASSNRPCTLPVTLTGRERGAWLLGPMVLRVDGRLGLVRRALRWTTGDAVAVVPSMAGVRRYRLLSLHHRLHDVGVRALRRRGDGGSFAGLREYVVGDDPRLIDWKATARRDQLITREYTVEQGQTVLLALDAGRMMTQLEDAIPRYEYALSSALLLADVAIQSRDQVGALIFDDEIRGWAPPTRGRAALERLTRVMVPTVATMTEPDYAAAFRALGERQRKRSLIVLFTDVIDVRASQALIALTSRGAARHVVVVVALRNDRLLKAATPRRDASTRRLYEAAAAEELVTAREAALARMRRAGVSVVDVSPHAMTAAVINRYLELKARSSL
jgi:uncharacterized protein (DUF58 family)